MGAIPWEENALDFKNRLERSEDNHLKAELKFSKLQEEIISINLNYVETQHRMEDDLKSFRKEVATNFAAVNTRMKTYWVVFGFVSGIFMFVIKMI